MGFCQSIRFEIKGMRFQWANVSLTPIIKYPCLRMRLESFQENPTSLTLEVPRDILWSHTQFWIASILF